MRIGEYFMESGETEKAIEELTMKFDSMSQTVRRELEHFDFILKEEFEQAFSSYNSYYFNSINKSREATSGSLAAPSELIANILLPAAVSDSIIDMAA